MKLINRCFLNLFNLMPEFHFFEFKCWIKKTCHWYLIYWVAPLSLPFLIYFRIVEIWWRWFTCRLRPGGHGSSSWPTIGSDRSAGWDSGKSLVSAGYFLWPLTTPPDLLQDNHFDRNIRESQRKKKKTDIEIKVNFNHTSLLPMSTHASAAFLQQSGVFIEQHQEDFMQ